MASAQTFRYRVVDVFTQVPLEGNALAVFPDSKNLDDATMQKIARELNLSETVFLTPSRKAGCLARARIFTPTMEMQFAGHPTVGAAFVLHDEKAIMGATHFSLEEQIGTVPVRIESGERTRVWLTTPPITTLKKYDPAVCTQALGLQTSDILDVTPQLLTAGNPCIFIALKNKAAVDRAFLDLSGYRQLGADIPTCVFVFTPTPQGAYSRMFGIELGVIEDPATGSATGPLAAFMMKNGLISSADGTTFVSEQGTKMGRRSFLHVIVRGDGGRNGIEVGGYVTPLVEAQMTIPVS